MLHDIYERPLEESGRVAANPQLAKEINEEGTKYFYAGQFKLAEHFFRAAHVADSVDPVFAGNVVSSLIEQKRYKEAAAFAREHYDRYQGHPWFLYAFMDALHWSHEDPQTGVEICKKLESDKDYGSVAAFEFRYGYHLFRIGYFTEAEEHFKKAIKLNECTNTFSWLSGCFLKQGNFSSNEAYFTERLLTEREGNISPALRHAEMAKFYQRWFEYLRDSDPAMAASKIVKAKELIGEAEEYALFGDVDEEVKKVAELAAIIEKQFQRLINEFELPSEYTPD